jgi:Ni/Co efflux regulator RcnB
MKFSPKNYVSGIVLGAALVAFSGVAAAQDQPRQDQRKDDRGRPEDQRRGGDDRNARGDDHNGRADHREGNAEYHFREEDRGRFSPHYEKDIRQWRDHPDRRHSNFRAGERLPAGVRLKSVPTSYYRELPPPPPGYRLGYYDGYVVAYNPTTQIIADVLDLVSSAARR